MNNLPLEERVILLKDKDLNWGFDDAGASYYIKTPLFPYGHQEKVDPFPCYSHDRDLVIECAAKLEKLWPLKTAPYYFLLSHESVGRSNGWHRVEWYQYENKETNTPRKHVSIITLSGKRIPVLTSMTRYLCSHEYGHAVDEHIVHSRNGPDGCPTWFDKQYAEMRGIPCSDAYGARNWHTNIGEVIANDFRICVAGEERDSWPHPFTHPDKDLKIHNYWYELMLNYL